MGLFSKIKDILFEEETVEIPIVDQKEEIRKIQKELKESKQPEEKKFELPKEKKEEIKEEKIISPKKEETKERDLYKSEPTFPFPLAFDEEPEIPSRTKVQMDKIKEVPKREKKEIKKVVPKKEEVKEITFERNTKPFKPSPVISPVYGILDKNYKKEDLVQKNKNDDLNIDKVRQKAFGQDKSLDADEIFVKTENGKTVDELLIDTLSINIDDIESKIEDKNNDNIIEDIKNLKKEEEKTSKKAKKEETPKEEENKKVVKEEVKKEKEDKDINDTLETDLFNLIDSMYDDEKDGE